jgi:lipopolysaccharide transport system ATP-binding protein
VSNIVVSVENLSKRYLIGHQYAQRKDYTTLRDVIGREARNFVRKAADLLRGNQIIEGDEVEEFWALRDVSFEVKQGEVVGIIGPNGAGKSTLLKILSRITEPTDGRLRLRGRVASLLEVGTGFHPELTGRENIYLNGAILGMSRKEIARKLDEIVAFAEIDRFLDTPVKRYSSGLFVRLAFAVAAHLEPEILVVDEVLAVGDVEFQSKCLGRMKHAAREGRTVLFVSHNLSVISTMCDYGIVLSGGHAAPKESASLAIARYRDQLRTTSSGSLGRWTNRLGNGQAKITDFKISTRESENGMVPLDSPATFAFHVEFGEPIHNPRFGILVHDSLGEVLLDLRSSNHTRAIGTCIGKRHVTATVPRLGLVPGHYVISIWVNNERETEDIDYVKTCGSFQVFDADATTRRGRIDRAGAKFWAASEWTITKA